MPSRQSILQHDEVIRALRSFVRDNPSQALAAGKAIDCEIKAEIAERNKVCRQAVADKVAMLEVAKRFVLDQRTMAKEIDFAIDPACPPKGFDPLGVPHNTPLPRWIKEVYLAVGHFNLDVRRTFCGVVEWFLLAKNVKFGNAKLRKRIDLRKTDAIDAYVAAVCGASHGRTPEDVRSELNPSKARHFAALPVWVFGLIVARLLRRRTARPITTGEAWRIAVIALTCEDPNFDPKHVGIDGLPTWEFNSPPKDTRLSLAGPRSRVLEHIRDLMGADAKTKDGPKTQLWLLAERVARDLKDSVPASRSDIRTPQAAVKLSDGHLNVLDALCRLKARSRESRKSAAEIAEAATGSTKASSVKQVLAQLRLSGLVDSVQGRRGGSWITRAGVQERATTRSRKPQQPLRTN